MTDKTIHYLHTCCIKIYICHFFTQRTLKIKQDSWNNSNKSRFSSDKFHKSGQTNLARMCILFDTESKRSQTGHTASRMHSQHTSFNYRKAEMFFPALGNFKENPPAPFWAFGLVFLLPTCGASNKSIYHSEF